MHSYALLSLFTSWLLGDLAGASQSNGSVRMSLAPFKYEAFPLGQIKASGWLQDQLSLSAAGLGGHLFDFYRYVQRSTWLGGEYEYSELHESAPYWFNYIVPLAWTLDDARLKEQARYFLDYTLEHQAAESRLGARRSAHSLMGRCIPHYVAGRARHGSGTADAASGRRQPKDEAEADPFRSGKASHRPVPGGQLCGLTSSIS